MKQTNPAQSDEKKPEEPVAGQGEVAQNQPPTDMEAKLAEAEKQAASFKDLYLRKAAEFDNYKRRMENETGLIIRFANEELLQSVLPVVDDLERSLKSAGDMKDSAFYKGVELIYQKIQKTLQAQGIRPFETVGRPFDVHYHDALLQVPKKGIPHHTILEEVEKGYMYHDKVLRHAKVVVSAEDESEQEMSAPEDQDERDEQS
ncbi:MAG TPA: nucleotide exchange factor GrpE [Bacteroidota bacterium]